MSQAGVLDIESSNPQIPTQFNADSGSAIPIGNQLNVYGGEGIDTSASGMTVTISSELATAAATVGAANIGSAAFSSADFDVTAGFVTIKAGSGGTDSFVTDSGTATQVAGSINILGGSGLSTSGSGDTVTVSLPTLNNGEVLIGRTGLDPVANTLTAGSGITITDGSGTIEIALTGGSTAIDSITIDDAGAGTNPVLPDGTGSISITGAKKSNDATKPIDTRSDGANSFQIRVQGAIASNSAAASLSAGIAYYFDEDFTVSAASRVDLVDTVVKSVSGDSGTATPSSHSFTIAGDTGLSTSGASDTVTISLDGSVVGQTITGDSGGALSPTAGNWNILGGNACSSSGSGGTLTIDVEGGGLNWVEETTTSRSLSVDEAVVGTNASTITMTLPDTAAFGSVIRVMQKGAGVVRIAQNAGETIHFGTQDTTTGAGGYIESTNQWDAINIVCVTANTDWQVLSSIGNWTVV